MPTTVMTSAASTVCDAALRRPNSFYVDSEVSRTVGDLYISETDLRSQPWTSDWQRPPQVER